MSWRGERGGIAAAKAGHDVIMTPANALYFDYGQGDTKFEPINIGNHVPLETVYNYNPIPKELTETEAKYVLGAQANVWTEYIKTPEKVEYMVFPRLLALSEVVWSPLENKNFAEFQKRLSAHFPRLDKQNVSYRSPEPTGLKNIILSGENQQKIKLDSLIAGAKIFYSLDGSEPTTVYEKPIELDLKPNETVEIRAIVETGTGRRSVIYTATVTNRAMIKSAVLNEKTSGVNVKFFKGNFKSVKDLDIIQPLQTIESKSIQLPQFSEQTAKFQQPFGAIFEGYISIPEDGIYEFQVEADDRTTLEIGDENIIDANSANEQVLKKYGMAPLQKGFHRIRLKYIQRGGAAILNLRWGMKGTGLRRIYGSELFR
jgi:hexosaminidase